MSTFQGTVEPFCGGKGVAKAIFLWYLVAAIAALIMFAPVKLYGQSVYEQAPTTSGGLFSNAGGLIAADQFVLKEPAAITAIRWCGFFQDASIVLSDLGPAEFVQPGQLLFRMPEIRFSRLRLPDLYQFPDLQFPDLCP